MNVHSTLHLHDDAARVHVTTYEDDQVGQNPAYATVGIATDAAIHVDDIETAEAMADAFTAAAMHLRNAARNRNQIVLVAV